MNVTEKLRTSKQESDALDHRVGFGLGQRWVEQRHEARPLMRLAQFRTETANFPDDYLERCFAGMDASSLFFIMYPEADKDYTAANDFWNCVLGDRLHQAVNVQAMLKGFADGALDVWDEVQDEL